MRTHIMASLLAVSELLGCAAQPYVDLPDGTRENCVMEKCYQDALAKKAAMEQRQKAEQEARQKAKDEADEAELAEKVAKEERAMKQAEQDKIMLAQPSHLSLADYEAIGKAAARLGAGSQPARDQDQSPDWHHTNIYGCPYGMVRRSNGGCQTPEYQYYPGGGYPMRTRTTTWGW